MDMSRWRETLCGSVLLPAYEKAQSVYHRLGESSEILSCGGQYLPHYKTYTPTHKINTAYVHLPKQEYEVVVSRTDENLRRYGGEIDPMVREMEMMDELETKSQPKVSNK